MADTQEWQTFKIRNPRESYLVYVLPDRLYLSILSGYNDEYSSPADPVDPIERAKINAQIHDREKQAEAYDENDKVQKSQKKQLLKQIKKMKGQQTIYHNYLKSEIQRIKIQKNWSDCSLLIEMTGSKRVLGFKVKNEHHFNFKKDEFDRVKNMLVGSYGDRLEVIDKK